MTRGADAVARHRMSKLQAGWHRLDGFIPLEAVDVAQKMIQDGSATSMIDAVRVALLSRPELVRQIDIMEAELAAFEHENSSTDA